MIDGVCKKWGMAINTQNSKILSINCVDANIPIQFNSHAPEGVESFTYLGSRINKSRKASEEDDTMIEKADEVYQM